MVHILEEVSFINGPDNRCVGLKPKSGHDIAEPPADWPVYGGSPNHQLFLFGASKLGTVSLSLVATVIWLRVIGLIGTKMLMLTLTQCFYFILLTLTRQHHHPVHHRASSRWDHFLFQRVISPDCELNCTGMQIWTGRFFSAPNMSCPGDGGES